MSPSELPPTEGPEGKESVEKPLVERVLGGKTKNENFELFETPLGRVAAKTFYGGPESKYRVNEDGAFVVCKQNRLSYGLIDGAGGTGLGTVAADAGCNSFKDSFVSDLGIKEAFEIADRAIREADRDHCYGTFAGVQVSKSEDGYSVEIMGAGDAKVVTIRDSSILKEGTTSLQNMAAYILDKKDHPEQYYVTRNINVILGGIGLPDPSEHESPDYKKIEGRAGDIFVLGSDGLWDNVSEYEVLKLAEKLGSFPGALQKAIFFLAEERNNMQGPFTIQHSETASVEKTLYKGPVRKSGDNITVMVGKLA